MWRIPWRKWKQSKDAGNAKQTGLCFAYCKLHILDTTVKQMLRFPSLSFPASFHWLPAWDFSETLVSPTQFLKTLPTLNYLNITKFRGEFLPSKNSSCPCKHSYIFTASQSEIFSRSKVLLLIQSSLKYQKEYHWGTEEVRKHQTKVWIWNLGDYWINVVHSLPPFWLDAEGQNIPIKYNLFWQDVSS